MQATLRTCIETGRLDEFSTRVEAIGDVDEACKMVRSLNGKNAICNVDIINGSGTMCLDCAGAEYNVTITTSDVDPRLSGPFVVCIAPVTKYDHFNGCFHYYEHASRRYNYYGAPRVWQDVPGMYTCLAPTSPPVAKRIMARAAARAVKK